MGEIDNAFKELLLTLLDEAKKKPTTISAEMLLALKECTQLYQQF